ncbi:phospholipase D-like domain-containing protein [Erythrobacter sp. 3-20A1M]|uniref:phospholipase D-like domain-containing protein n=1 Tax=Erythrobacter sp. 3-20A1M TaxID=2653850 RepID=UPI001BFC73B5|nr:phospholipase D-like domain-containing protein [Erythrobacter sp. 3-20A1M]
MSQPCLDEGGPEGDDSVEPGVWRYAQAQRLSVIIDAESYFAHMQQAMLKARRRIMLIGWDFDTRIHLTKGRRWYERPKDSSYPSRLGSFFLWLARHRDGLDILVLKWGLSIVQFAARGSMALDIARMWPKRQISFKFDTQHPLGCSHHQKIGVLDDSLAVCGGIDLTHDRWDTREHREHDERRRRPHGRLYGPWHDITMMMEGEVAGALADLCRSRWECAGGKTYPQLDHEEQESIWPDKLTADFEDVEVGISRTRAKYNDVTPINEIETLVLAQIAGAREFLYIENQYFTSRKIAEAIVERLDEDDPPEIVLVHPIHADGWLEQQAMDHARSALARMIAANDPKKRFSLYVSWAGETPIYVHAKLMIVDDRILRIGSANMNNRSLGLDSECDVFIDCERPANAGRDIETCIRTIRVNLLAEHCGVEPEVMDRRLKETRSMHQAIAQLGSSGERQLRPFEIPELGEIEQTLAGSELLDPEKPEDMFEPYAHGGLFRDGSRLGRLRDRLKRKRK